MEHINLVLVVAILMVCNTFLVSIDKMISKEFDWSIFYKGLIRYGAVLVVCLAICFAQNITPDIELVDVDIILKAIIAKYSLSVASNLKTIFEIDVNEEVKKETEINTVIKDEVVM